MDLYSNHWTRVSRLGATLCLLLAPLSRPCLAQHLGLPVPRFHPSHDPRSRPGLLVYRKPSGHRRVHGRRAPFRHPARQWRRKRLDPAIRSMRNSSARPANRSVHRYSWLARPARGNLVSGLANPLCFAEDPLRVHRGSLSVPQGNDSLQPVIPLRYHFSCGPEVPTCRTSSHRHLAWP